MRNVFKQKEYLEYVLQVIMEKQDLQVIDQIIQKDYKNLQERSAIQDDTEFGRQFTWKAISTKIFFFCCFPYLVFIKNANTVWMKRKKNKGYKKKLRVYILWAFLL